MAASLEKPAELDQITQVATHQHGSLQDVKLQELGYIPSLRRVRSTKTLLFMTLSISCIPFGIGGPMLSAIYGGGPLSLFVGALVVISLDGCVAVSLAELASRYPTSSGPYYWTFHAASAGMHRRVLTFLTGWIWLVGNWTITLSVNFGFASLLTATASLFKSDWTAANWQLLLIFYGICLMTFIICASGDRFLPIIDTCAAGLVIITVVASMIALSSTASTGRHSVGYSLTHYDYSLSGWGRGFTFFIGLLPPAYTFSAIGMITSMAEECKIPEVQVPVALTMSVVIGGMMAIAFILPICFTLPDTAELITAPYGQVLPFLLEKVLGSSAGAVALMSFVLLVTLFCSISVTTTASRCTFAFARDRSMPLWTLWSTTYQGQPIPALALVTVIQMLLGLINLGSSSAFTAFASVGVMGLAAGYLIPIAVSLFYQRREVSKARWCAGRVIGPVVNAISILWILFELVLFSMPVALPVTPVSMNYSSVVFIAFLGLSLVSYVIYGRKVFLDPGQQS